MLQVRNLKKSFRMKKDNKVFQALNGVSFDLPKTGFVCIVGKSGSGKSTLLNILGGLDKADSGEIIIKGKSSKTSKAKDFDSYRNTYLGFIFQEFNLLEEETIKKNVELALELQSYKGDINQKVDELLTKVDLLDKKNNKINEISGGQKQRVAIARALIKNPEIIIADEPTGNLDTDTGDSVMKILRELADEKLVVMVTHDLDYTVEYADRVIELADGVIIRDTTRDVRSLEEVKSVNSDSPIEKIVRIPRSKRVDTKTIDEFNELIAKHEDEDLYIAITTNKEKLSKYEPTVLRLSSEEKGKSEPVNLDYSSEEKFKLIKSHYPIKDALKMGAINVWRKRLTLVFTIILMVFAVGLYGESATLKNFEFGKPAATAIAEDKTTIIEFNAGDKISDEQYEQMIKKFSGSKFGKFYQFGDGQSNHSDESFYKPGRKFLSDLTLMKGVIYAESIEDLRFNKTLVDGELPTAANEVLISDYLADSMLSSIDAFYDYNDILGQYVYEGLLIKGIYETNYEEYREVYDEVLKFINLENNSIDTRKVPSEILEKYTKWHNYKTIISQPVSYNKSLLNDYKPLGLEAKVNGTFVMESNGASIPIYEPYIIAAHYEVSGGVDYGNAIAKVLGNDEIIVSYSTNQMYSVQIGDIISITTNFNGTVEKRDFTVVGIKDQQPTAKEAEVYFSLDTFKMIGEKTVVERDVTYTQHGLFFPSWTISKDAKVLQYLEKGNGFNLLVAALLDNGLGSSLATITFIFRILGVVFKVIAYVFLAFAAILLFNNIMNSVMNRKKDIGTLRAIGAKGLDVSWIFVFESLIIALIVTTLAVGGVYVVSGMLNEVVKSALNIKLNFFNVTIKVILSMYGAGVGVSIISALIPVKRVTAMRPIDAIRK